MKDIYGLEDRVGEKALNLNLLLELGLVKNTLPTSFPNHLLENA
jgi:hypothetical protein